MADVTYEIVEYDGGWAYKLGDTISQRYPTRESAMINAEQAAGDQQARRNADDKIGDDRKIQGQDDGPRDLDNPTPS
jgi:hypothetical protein